MPPCNRYIQYIQKALKIQYSVDNVGIAEGMGFEPTDQNALLQRRRSFAYKADALNHSATPPCKISHQLS